MIGGYCEDGYRRLAADTELEGEITEDRSMEEGDGGGHGPKTAKVPQNEIITIIIIIIIIIVIMVMTQ